MTQDINSIDDIDPKYSKNYSEDSFWDKIKSVLKSAGLPIIYKALQLYYAMDNPNCPIGVKAGIIAALGYFISPLDIIPDFIPVLGFTDDLAAIGAAIVMANMYIDDEVKRKARAKIDDIFGAGTSAELEEDSKDNKKAISSGNNSTIDAMERLKKLKELLDMGVISQEEYDQKKAELLSRI